MRRDPVEPFHNDGQLRQLLARGQRGGQLATARITRTFLARALQLRACTGEVTGIAQPLG